MSLDTIAGNHDIYFAENGASTAVWVGNTGDGNAGIQLIETPNVDLITGDALGPNSPVDGVFRGKNVVLQFILQDVKKDVCKKLMRPFTATTADPNKQEEFGIPGTLLSASYMGKLELIPRTGTPAAAYKTGGNGRRFYGVHIGQNREDLDTGKRFIPITFQCFPWDDAGTTKIWKWITAANA